jgi:hypothetical protein
VRSALKIAWTNLAVLATLLSGMECLAFGYYFVRHTLAGYDQVRDYVKTQVAKMPLDGYPHPEDRSWFATYWEEFNSSTYAAVQSVSYSNWYRYPFKSRYINVDQAGRRATWNQDPDDAPGLLRVWIFGGSTVWGTGARDEFTIPSYMSKMLAERYPHRFHVVNYGQDGYVMTQEVVTLLREIQRNSVPDIVVFYDGYNESFTAFQRGAAGFPMNEDNRIREFNILHPSRARDFYLEVLSRTNTFQLIQGVRRALRPEAVANPLKDRNNEALAQDVVRVYFRNVEFVSAMEKQFGVAAQFFWQPSVYTRARPTKQEVSMIHASDEHALLYRKIHEAMKRVDRATHPAKFRDISNVLDRYGGTAFIDTVHATELANEVIAREIVAGLTDTLKARLSRAAAVRPVQTAARP